MNGCTSLSRISSADSEANTVAARVAWPWSRAAGRCLCSTRSRSSRRLYGDMDAAGSM